MGGTVKFDIVLSSDCHYQSFSKKIYLIESHENTTVEFSFAIWANGNAKKYICGTFPFKALEVYPTMTTSAAEKHGNVKKVY